MMMETGTAAPAARRIRRLSWEKGGLLTRADRALSLYITCLYILRISLLRQTTDTNLPFRA